MSIFDSAVLYIMRRNRSVNVLADPFSLALKVKFSHYEVSELDDNVVMISGPGFADIYTETRKDEMISRLRGLI